MLAVVSINDGSCVAINKAHAQIIIKRILMDNNDLHFDLWKSSQVEMKNFQLSLCWF
jgi:hypothetical protein